MTSASAEENTDKIQHEIIPRALRWAAASGVTFDPSKTSFVHFTRQIKYKNVTTKVEIHSIAKESEDACKVLGVYLDRELRFKEHAKRIAIKGIKAVLALKRLKGLQARTARQLYQATVIPIIDYASPIWSPTATNLILKALEPTQRLAAPV